MKRTIFIIIVGLMILYVGNKTTEAFVDNDLDKIANNINQIDPDAEITDWIILARSSSDAPFDKIRTQLRDELPGYVWTMEESSHGQTWIGKFTREDLGIVTTIKIMSAGSKTYLIHSISGHEWTDRQVNFIHKGYPNDIKEVFVKKPSYFACIKGITGDTMDKVLLKNWMNELEAKPLESAIEDNFISVASKSKQFGNTMTNGVNLQLAFRKDGLGGGTRFTIGTPIIAFEY